MVTRLLDGCVVKRCECQMSVKRNVESSSALLMLLVLLFFFFLMYSVTAALGFVGALSLAYHEWRTCLFVVLFVLTIFNEGSYLAEVNLP